MAHRAIQKSSTRNPLPGIGLRGAPIFTIRSIPEEPTLKWVLETMGPPARRPARRPVPLLMKFLIFRVFFIFSLHLIG